MPPFSVFCGMPIMPVLEVRTTASPSIPARQRHDIELAVLDVPAVQGLGQQLQLVAGHADTWAPRGFLIPGNGGA